jgi:hypothetical protein
VAQKQPQLGPEDIVAVNHDAWSIETSRLLGLPPLNSDPEQVVGQESGAGEKMHQANLKAAI